MTGDRDPMEIARGIRERMNRTPARLAGDPEYACTCNRGETVKLPPGTPRPVHKHPLRATQGGTIK